MNSKKESTKIKDFVRIGVFSALWIATSWVIACTIGFFPPVMLALPCLLGLLGAMILVVMLSKLSIRGGILVASFLFGICLFSMAPYGLMFICPFIGGIIGELIYNTLGKNSNIGKALGIICPMLGLALGEYLPLCYMQTTYKNLYAEKGTLDMAVASMNLINTPLVIILTIVTIICTYFGFLWGNRIMKKRLK